MFLIVKFVKFLWFLYHIILNVIIFCCIFNSYVYFVLLLCFPIYSNLIFNYCFNRLVSMILQILLKRQMRLLCVLSS